MTKADLVARICDQLGPQVTRRDCLRVVDAFLDSVKQTVAEGHHIEIRGFGTFSTRMAKQRPARNPRTGAAVHVPARRVPTFKMHKELKAVAAGRS